VNIADKPLSALSDDEWERLCDGCGLCCMHKFEDEDSGEMLYTAIACRLFGDETCRCRDYHGRLLQVSDCMQIRAFSPAQMRWLPASCAYRLRFEGRLPPAWHPLVSGNPETVHAAGISMRGRSIPEQAVPEQAWSEYIVSPPDTASF
jgi:uncharacterized protein